MSTFYSEVLSNTIHVRSSRQGWRNTPPYAPSAYLRIFSAGTNFDARSFNAESQVAVGKSNIQTVLDNRLRARFSNSLGDSSSFGATLTAEARETFSMVSSTVLRCFRAARCVKRLDFAGCARELGIPYRERTRVTTRGVGTKMVRGRKQPARYIRSRQRVFTLPTGREVQKTLANGWLLWSYGVKPLASDIYNGLDVLQRPLEYKKPVRVTAGDTSSYKEVLSGGGYVSTTTWAGSVRGAYGALVSVSNPNAYLANKMGLANPLQWALEAIPFSFVVDWFSNLSQVVGQFNEFYGYTIERKWRSYKYQASRVQVTSYSQGFSVNGFVFRRYTDAPPVTLVFAYERFGLQRALNAISLLVGFLPRSR
jgi:hypothetical protein